MNFVFTASGLRIGRDSTDRPIRKESTVIYRAIKELNAGETIGTWKRFYPDRHGLTASRIGLCNKKRKVAYWHGNFAIESAHAEFNAGALVLNKV